MPLHRREARVEIVRHALGGDHRHRMRAQMRGERVAHGVGVPFLRQIDMRDLPERMHAGVGAAGAVDGDALAGQRRDRVGQHALHRQPVAWICQPTNGVPSYSMVSL